VSTEIVVDHGQTSIHLSHPNPQIRSRNESFSSKEPDTLEWIDRFSQDSTLWDIGANVGLYSVYAGLRGTSVVAIEPSVFNLEFLVRNISLNKLDDKVSVLPIAVGGIEPGFAALSLRSCAWGDSQNAFATLMGQSGEVEQFTINYRVFGVSLDGLMTSLGLSPPDYLKVDVDGIEPAILRSGPLVLSRVRSVLVEIPTYRGALDQIGEILTSSGLTLETSLRRNQIWSRDVVRAL
jgi:FkbM family methyltransferase